jgi:phenylalanyl-tRNA synthetase beta chain
MNKFISFVKNLFHTEATQSTISAQPAPTVFQNIIVAEVTKVEKHPNADRLRVIELTDGQITYAPIVCGAWNFDVGARVALALPGATIPHDQHDPEEKPFTLGKAKIRGVESRGMICSGKELGLSDDGQGILILPANTPLGGNFSSDLVKS